MATAIFFVVVAYKWGLRDAHSYVVGGSPDRAKAIALAEQTVEDRGGKYGCEVVDAHGETPTQIHYVESPYYGQAGAGRATQPADNKKPLWPRENPDHTNKKEKGDIKDVDNR